MDEAAAANRSDTSQTGFLVELPSRGDVLVSGDLHGNRRNLDRIINRANLPRFRERHLVVQELVHETEGKSERCRSYRLVEMVARLKVSFPEQVHVLLGNHEFAEVVDLPIGKRGRELNSAFAAGLEAAYGERWREVKEAYCRFWRSCTLAVRTPNRIFIVHSTPRLEKMADLDLAYLRRVSAKEVFRRRGAVFPMLWGRDYRPEAARAFAESLLELSVGGGADGPVRRDLELCSKPCSENQSHHRRGCEPFAWRTQWFHLPVDPCRCSRRNTNSADHPGRASRHTT